VERLKLLEEKRRWAVDQMLAELPPTPGPDPDLLSPPRPSKTIAKQPSPPRVRPRKVGGSKGSSKSPSKKTALARRMPGGTASGKPDSSNGPSVGKENEAVQATRALDNSETPQVKPTGTPEDELQRSTTPEEWPPSTPPAPTVAAEMKTSLPLILPTTFTLPPPSPASSLAPLDLGSISPSAPPVQVRPSSSTVSSFDAIPLAPSAHPPIVPIVRPRIFPSPRTPRAVVGAQKKHAYSPARPSPLSRILMIADSPPSPLSVSTVREENEECECVTPLESPMNAAASTLPKRFLARERWDAPTDEPGALRERTGVDLNGFVGADAGLTDTSGENKLANHDEKRFTAKEKGKGRVAPAVKEVTVMEKENVASTAKVTRPGKAKVTFSSNGGTAADRVKPSKPSGRNSSVVVKGGLKPTLTNARSGTSSGRVRDAGSASQSSARVPGLAAVRVAAGGARRVPNASANAGKLGMGRI
jgi:hypothetical protein